ncbi:hypothetical protein [Microvirga makkahensis]|uniref:Uncharacterized protein n=1 Tax=Microvirga makkahensis TaxID=1128670 RepID=A0A7X3MSX6_9HYPH|nr:hypothetical protein [Microvirga makkahensis]MXQ12478.1 hypothetical protein [Microvirga makkahensis]
MQRIIPGLAFLAFSIASTGGAFSADNTRVQHRNWIRKLDTPGGTLVDSLDVIMEDETSRRLMPGGTASQHRSWIKKLETSDPVNGVSL